VLDRDPVGCTADEAGLGLALNWVQHALVTACENNCPVRPVKPVSTSLRWTARLESLRNVRRLFNKSRRDQTTHSREFHREAQQAYKKEVRKASKETWRAFCTSINELPTAARLHRALSRDLKVRLGSLVAPSGGVLSLRGKHLTSSWVRIFQVQEQLGRGYQAPLVALCS
jgi:hypothetical protein